MIRVAKKHLTVATGIIMTTVPCRKCGTVNVREGFVMGTTVNCECCHTPILVNRLTALHNGHSRKVNVKMDGRRAS